MLDRLDAIITGTIRAVIITIAAIGLVLWMPWLLILAVVVCLYLWPGATIFIGVLLVCLVEVMLR